MTIGRLGFLAYLIFLAGYAIYKYSVAAPPEFSAGYFQSVLTLVLMTGVAPFVVTYSLLKMLGLKGLAMTATGLVVGLTACVFGYAAFWYFFIAPAGSAPAVYDVAIRGVGWGLLQGGLAALAAHPRQATT